MHRALPSLPPGTERGFTLLEMLVVLTITGLIAGLLYPQIEKSRGAVAQRLVREQVTAGMAAARAAALRSGAPVALRADASGLVIAGRHRIALAATDKLVLQPQTIVFYPDGSTTGGHLTLGTGPAQTAFEIPHVGGHLSAGKGG